MRALAARLIWWYDTGGGAATGKSSGKKPKYGGSTGWQTTNHPPVSAHIKPKNKFGGGQVGVSFGLKLLRIQARLGDAQEFQSRGYRRN